MYVRTYVYLVNGKGERGEGVESHFLGRLESSYWKDGRYTVGMVNNDENTIEINFCPCSLNSIHIFKNH